MEPVGGAYDGEESVRVVHVHGETYVALDLGRVVEVGVDALWPLERGIESVACWDGDLVPVSLVVSSTHHALENAVSVGVCQASDVDRCVFKIELAVRGVFPASGEDPFSGSLAVVLEEAWWRCPRFRLVLQDVS